MADTNLITKHKKTKIGLAFGGGGARGFAHLGTIKAFEEYGITKDDFDFICGTSAGSLVGCMYAYGLTYAEILAISKTVDESDIRTNKIPLMPSKTDGLQDVLRKNLGDINIEDLKTKFAAVAVDIKTTKEIALVKGNLAKAVAASCCVPGVFVPVEFDNYLLCDGGLKNTIPTNIPKVHGCDYVIGVDVNKHRTYGTDSSKMIDVLSCSIRILMESNAIKGYLHSDLMIAPETKRFKASKMDGFMDMIEEGYKETIDKMEDILRLLSSKPVKKKVKLNYEEEEVEFNG